MTFIQPHKTFSFANTIIVLMVILTIGATITLVTVYNGIVNAEHNIASLKSQLDQVGAQNTNLQNKIVAQLGSDAMAQLASQAGLVEDKNPQYLSANSNNQSLTLR